MLCRQGKDLSALLPQYLSNFFETVFSRFTSNFSHKRTAFTLAEVLVTIGIIGIVSALILPSLIANYREKVFVKYWRLVSRWSVCYMVNSPWEYGKSSNPGNLILINFCVFWVDGKPFECLFVGFWNIDYKSSAVSAP